MWYNIYCIVKATAKPNGQPGENKQWHEPKELVYLIFNSLRGIEYDHRAKDSSIFMDALDSPGGQKLMESAKKEKFEEDNAEIYYESKDFSDLNSGEHSFSIAIDSFDTAAALNDYIKGKKAEETIWIAGMYVHVGDLVLPAL